MHAAAGGKTTHDTAYRSGSKYRKESEDTEIEGGYDTGAGLAEASAHGTADEQGDLCPDRDGAAPYSDHCSAGAEDRPESGVGRDAGAVGAFRKIILALPVIIC